MVTLYLAGTSIRLESKITVGERMLEKYKKFKEEMPKEFSISRTRRGCFAYLNQRYTGSNVAAQAENLEDENVKIIERLATLSAIETINEKKDARDLLFQKMEEDDDWRQNAITFMEHPNLIKAAPTVVKGTIDWLKSLKPQKQKIENES